MDWSAITQNLIFLFAGAIVGLFGSIGYDLYKQVSVKNELKNRIKEEFKIVLYEIQLDYDHNNFIYRKFSTIVFKALRNDLVRKFDAVTYRAIEDSYDKIQDLENFTNSERDKKIYEIAINSITNTLEILK
jgi:hypothetical protein